MNTNTKNKTILNIKTDKGLKGPSKMLKEIIKKANEDYKKGDVFGPFDNVKDLVKSLES